MGPGGCERVSDFGFRETRRGMDDVHLGAKVRRAVARMLQRRRATVIVVWLAVTLLAGAFAAGIRFDFSPEAVFVGQDDLVAVGNQAKATFGSADAVVVLLLEATGPDDCLCPAALRLQDEISKSLAADPDVERVDGPATVETLRFRLFRPFVYAVPVLPGGEIDEAAARAVRDWVDRSPAIVGALVAPDRRATLTAVRLNAAVRGQSALRTVLDRLETRVAAVPLPPGFRLHWSGIPTLRVDIVRGLERDQRFLLPAAAGMFLVLLCVLFRRIGISLLAMAAVLTGLAWTLGAVAATGGALNIISNVLPVLLTVIGVSNVVHVVARYAEECARPGRTREQAATATAAHAMLSCAMTFSTTAVGFVGLAAARSLVLQELGLQAALGMFFLYAAIVVLLGAGLAWFRPPQRVAEPLLDPLDQAPAEPRGAFAELGRGVVRRPWTWLAIGAILCGGACVLARRAHIDSYTSETYDRTQPFMRGLAVLDRDFGGLLPLEIILTASSPQVWDDPATLSRLESFTRWLRTQPEVGRVRSCADFLAEIENRRAPPEGAPPDAAEPDPERRRRRLQRQWQLSEQFSQTFQLRRYLSADRTAARIEVLLPDIGTRATLQLMERIAERAKLDFPADCGLMVRTTGDAAIHSVALDRFIHDLFGSLIGAAVVIFCLMGLMLNSWKLGLIAVPPNVAPLLIVLGWLGLRGLELNVAHVIVLSISLGIAVDDTVHFMLRFQEEFARDGRVEGALLRTFAGCGGAIFLTSFLIVAGLSVLLFSDFLPTRRFAELTIVTMTAALAGDLILLPALLRVTYRDRTEPRLPPPSSTAESACSPVEIG